MECKSKQIIKCYIKFNICSSPGPRPEAREVLGGLTGIYVREAVRLFFNRVISVRRPIGARRRGLP